VHERRNGSTRRLPDASPVLPEWNGWVEDNAWYTDNPVAQAAANSLSYQKAQSTGLSGTALWNSVKADIQKAMPNVFEAQTPAAQAVEAGGGIPPKGKKTYSDLPSEDKAICDDFVNQGYLTKDKFLKDYNWSK